MSDKNFKVKSGLNLPITSAAILTTDSSGNISSTSALAITNGGTGQTSANNALNALLPIQNGGTVNYTIQSDGTNVSWAKVYNQLIQNGGVSVTPRRNINIIGGAFTDNAGTDTTTIDLSDKASLSSANTFTTSPQTINAAASAVGILITANATTPGNLLEFRNSAASLLSSFSNAGTLVISNNNFGANGITLINNNSSNTQLRVTQNTVSQTLPIATFTGNASTTNSVFTNAGQLVTGGTASATASYTITMTSASFTSTTATFTYAASAQLLGVSQKVILAGFTPSGYNGTYQISSVATVSAGVSYSFTVANTTNTAFSVSTGTAQFTPGNTATTLGAAVTPLVVKSVASQVANLQEWQNSTGSVLASISASGDLAVQNFTVNGTTTTVNSTTLTISDKNIEIAKVASPTDTTADGAGITIKGTTDKTFNWVQSTATFTSSEPISAPAFKSAGTAVSSNITLLSGYKYYVDTTSVRTLTLPASPSLGDEIVIYDASNSALTNNITVLPNGNKVQGSIQTLIVDSNAAVAYLAYTGSTYGWAVN